MNPLDHDAIRHNVRIIAASAAAKTEPDADVISAVCELLAQALCDLRTIAVSLDRQARNSAGPCRDI